MEDALVGLSNGDITKVEWIEQHVTVEAAKPYLQRMQERRAVDLAILGLCGVQLPWLNSHGHVKKALPMVREDVVIGGYCHGRGVSDCTKQFGAALWLACRTCPD